MDASSIPLSKNAQKKAAKAERYAAYKLERRTREKEAKKEKKRIKAQKRAAGELVDEEDQKPKKRPRIADSERFGGKVVIDLGFDDKMNEKEIKSLTSQLAYTYSSNRNAGFHFELIFTSLNGRTFTRLEGESDAGYKRWSKTRWWSEGYEKLWQESITDKDNVVYLTADSTEELVELKPEETYIIGGICDHNRYKNLCLDKGVESGIRTARLPIGRFVASLPTRKVLTVNQVFDIMIRWVETKDWEDAFYEIIPKRKFQGGERPSKNTDEEEVGDAQDESKTESP